MESYGRHRLLYGTKVFEMKQCYIKQLEWYQRKSLEQIQHLPDRTHNSVTLALMGMLPIEMTILMDDCVESFLEMAFRRVET